MVQRMPLMKALLKHVTPGLVGVLHISITAMWNKAFVIIVRSYDLMWATLKNTHHQISCGTETLTDHCNSSDSTSDGISHSPGGSHWTPASVSGGCLVDGPAPGLALGRGGGISVTNKWWRSSSSINLSIRKIRYWKWLMVVYGLLNSNSKFGVWKHGMKAHTHTATAPSTSITQHQAINQNKRKANNQNKAWLTDQLFQ